jgi:hypothetical protein
MTVEGIDAEIVAVLGDCELHFRVVTETSPGEPTSKALAELPGYSTLAESALTRLDSTPAPSG